MYGEGTFERDVSGDALQVDPLMISCALYDKFSTKWQIHSKGSCES